MTITAQEFKLTHSTMLHLLQERKSDKSPWMHTHNAGKQVASISYHTIYSRMLQHREIIIQETPASSGYVLLEGTNDVDFIINFFAIQAAGYIPVPVATSLWVAEDRYLEIIESISETTQAVMFIASDSTQHLLTDNQLHVITLKIANSNDLAKRAKNLPIDESTLILPSQNDEAYLQFSSGSTGNPKGVVITHYNVMSNVQQLTEHLSVDKHKDATVCWLPVHHDMGLLAGILIPIYSGLDSHLMNPYDFAVNPSRWLRLASKVKASILTGPNSAFHMAMKKIKPANRKKLDLSHVRVAMCAAEPVNAKTLHDFYEAFKECGFKEEAFLPAYGLAESTLGVSLYDVDKKILIDRIDKDDFLKNNKATPTKNHDAIEYVACGKPLRAIEVKIVDDNYGELPERNIGNILISGPSTTTGYHDRDDLNTDLFTNGMLKTGDLGYIADGEIYITGRKKDVIIVNGQNINAEEIETQAIKMKNIRAGRLVAFAVKNDETSSEKIHILVETKEKHKYLLPKHRRQLKKQISEHVSRFVPVRNEQITLLPPGSILKTTSGKVRRNDMKALFEQGQFPENQISFSYRYLEYRALTLRAKTRIIFSKMSPSNAR